jgi:hypothetical protein
MKKKLTGTWEKIEDIGQSKLTAASLQLVIS